MVQNVIVSRLSSLVVFVSYEKFLDFSFLFLLAFVLEQNKKTKQKKNPATTYTSLPHVVLVIGCGTCVRGKW